MLLPHEDRTDHIDTTYANNDEPFFSTFAGIGPLARRGRKAVTRG